MTGRSCLPMSYAPASRLHQCTKCGDIYLLPVDIKGIPEGSMITMISKKNYEAYLKHNGLDKVGTGKTSGTLKLIVLCSLVIILLIVFIIAGINLT